MNTILAEKQVIKSKRQSPSLKQILTKAKFSTENTPAGVTKCGVQKCGTCPLIEEGKTFSFKCGFNFEVKTSISCKGTNLLYVLKCSGCGENYIGQTGNSLRKRITVHRQQIKDPKYRFMPVSRHIHKCTKNMDIKFTVFPFYKFTQETNQTERELKENYFIQKFNPSLNKIQN